MNKLSKEFLLELGEFARFPGELIMACLLMASVDVGIIRAFGLSLPAPLVTDFARLIVQASDESDDATEEEAIREFRDEYPELAEYLSEVYYEYDDDIDKSIRLPFPLKF
jgi:hypothetical protein